MARKAATADPDSGTTNVNIADFQRTRDSLVAMADAMLAFAAMGQSNCHLLISRDNAVMQELATLNAAFATLTQDIEDSTRMPETTSLTLIHEKVIVALATLQSSVQDLSRAYINHANTVLNPGRSGTLDVGLTNTLVEAGLLSTVRGPGNDVMALEEPASDGKKKRKRAKHDPNAPKRALTPYFLYMQTARSQIARELGPHAKPKEVADEGTRRWGGMKDEDKAVWNEEYQKNLAVYRVKTAAYKAQQPVPSDEEAQRLVEAGKVPAIIADPEIEVEEEDEEEEVEEEEEEEDTPEPVKEPTPPKAKRRKSDKTAPVVEAAPVKSTPKKEKASKKAKKEATPPPPAPAATSNKKKSKKAA